MSEDRRTMDAMTWWSYVERVARPDTNATIAKKIGVSAPSVSRWQGKNSADPTTAAAFARAYNRPVLEAFLAAGFLTPEEAGQQPAEPASLADLTHDELIDEVRRRMEGALHGLAGHEQKSAEPPERGNVGGMEGPFG